MRQATRMLRKWGGFTMVELMIVIAIIGIIAVAVLSAINPIEQINKGNDTKRRSDASELLNAMERYYATHELYPTQTTSGEWATSNRSVVDIDNVVNALVAENELKSAYLNRVGSGATQTNLQIDLGSSEDQVFVCFVPKSAQFKIEASKKCASGMSSIYPEGPCEADSWTDVSDYCMP